MYKARKPREANKGYVKDYLKVTSNRGAILVDFFFGQEN